MRKIYIVLLMGLGILFVGVAHVDAAIVGYDQVLGSNANGNYNRLNMSMVTVGTGEGGTVSSGSMYLGGGASTTTVYIAVYADSSGSPGSLLAVSNGVSVASGQSAGWVNFTFSPSFSLSDGQIIWLSHYIDGTGTSSSTGGAVGRYSNSVLGDWTSGNDGYRNYGDAPVPNPAGTMTTYSQHLSYSLYLNSVQNTPPTITVNPVVSYSGYTRTGSSINWNLDFSATDAQQTGANQLTYYVHTGANRTGTQVATGTFTSGAADVYHAYNASGMVEGSNTLYLSVYDGTAYASGNPSFTVNRDSVAPSSISSISTTPATVASNNQYTVSLTVTDATSTNADELNYQISTGIGGSGTMLASWAGATTGVADTSTLITDAALAPGANTRYIRACDGAFNCTNQSFTVTKVQPPTVSLSTPTGLTSSEITLNATANPNNNQTEGYFRVWPYNPYSCIDAGPTSYPGSGRHPITGGDTLNGSTPQAFSHTVTNLIPNKTYYYCAIAESAGGKSYHSTTPSSFTTPNGPQNSCDGPPNNSITIGSTANCSFPGANNITGADGSAFTMSSGAALTIQAGQTVVFQTLSKPGATINKVAGGVMRKGYIWVRDLDGDGFYDPSSVQFSTSPSTPPGAGYVRRSTLGGAAYLSQAAECNDSAGTVTAATCAPAGTAPDSVTNITSTTATLNGVSNPNGDAGTRAYFKWGSTNTGECETLASSTSATLLSGTTNQNYSVGISGLTNMTTYYWCTIVYNNSGESVGDISSFVAQNSAPTLTTPTKSSLGATSATLGATVTSNGGAALTARGTCWGTSPNPTGNCTAEGGTSVASYSHSRTSLTAASVIYYRGYATNAIGTAYSPDDTFYTAPNLSVTANAAATQSDLTWGAMTGSTGFTLKWCTGAGCTPSTTIAVGNGTSYTHVHGQACGTTIRYALNVTGTHGTSGDSTVQQVIPLCAVNAPTLNAVAYNQVDVTYGSVTGATSYDIYRCTTSNCSSQSGALNDAASPYSDTGVSATTTYWYRIRARSANATSAFSSISSSVTTPAACTNGYVDNDGDQYGAGSYGCYSSGTIVATGGDCYDSNATARPTTGPNPYNGGWRTAHRGDGSFDWDCSGTTTTEYATTVSNVPWGCTSSCPSSITVPGWRTSAPACGASGNWITACSRFSDVSCNISIGNSISTCTGGSSCYSSGGTVQQRCR